MSIKGPRLAAIALLTRILDHRQTLKRKGKKT